MHREELIALRKLKILKSDIKFTAELDEYIAYLETHYEDQHLAKKLASFKKKLVAMEERIGLLDYFYGVALNRLRLLPAFCQLRCIWNKLA